MPQVVQAKCPHCHNYLRIPAEWLAMPMRCKFCKKAFQAQGKSAASASASANAVGAMAAPAAKTNVPVAKPANAVKPGVPTASFAPPVPPPIPVAAPARSFNFDQNQAAAVPLIQPRYRPRGKSLTLLIFFFLFGLAGTAAALVGYDLYKDQILSTLRGESKQVVKKEEPRPVKPLTPAGEAKPVPKADPDTPPKMKEEPKKNPNPVVEEPKKTQEPKAKEQPKPVLPPPMPKNTKKPPPKEVKDPTPPPFSTDPFPRRALLISVQNYMLYSPLEYGNAQAPSPVKGKGAPGFPGSSTGALRDRLTRPPMNFPATQVVELSDGAAKPHPTQKSAIETSIQEFLELSRDQDRVLILFAGHGAVVEKEVNEKKIKTTYLVPSDGNVEDEKTLIPLAWVYGQLAKCKAQQKLLILDAFRFSPSRGAELPSPGEGDEGKMPEDFDKELQNPPAGVQVWCSCVKDQSAIEFESGSAFLLALCDALQESAADKMASPAAPTEPFPLEKLVPKVNQFLLAKLTASKRTQTARLTGKEPDGAAKFDPKVPLPPQYVLKLPAGGTVADVAQVNGILDELRKLEPFRDSRLGDLNRVKGESLLVSAKTLEPFKAEGYQNVDELYKRYKADNEKFSKDFPLRAAFFDTVDKLKESSQLRMRHELAFPVDPKKKAGFIQEQEPIGKSIFSLEGTLANMNDAVEKRDDETKRWQANFDYAHARLLSRLIYLYEYNFTLGLIRSDQLPEIAPKGWRIASVPDISVKERKVKDYKKALEKTWKRIKKNYPDTPWYILGQRESRIAMGLQWRAKD